MQLRAFLFLCFLSFAFSSVAQNYSGVWEGYFYQRTKKHKINVRIEIIQEGNWVWGAISTRGFEKNTAYGCDYIVHGWFEKNSLTLGLENVQRAIAITKKDCTSFNQIELSLNSKDSVNTAKGRWFWIDDSKEVFVLKKTATEISEIARAEIDEMIKRTSGPETKKIDQLKLNGRSVSITVRPVVKDPKAPLCAWINGNVLVKDFNLAKNGLVIKLDDIAPVNRLVFLNNSTTGERLDVKITFQQGRKKKEWITSIDPLGEVLLVLTYKKEDLYSDRFPEFVSDQL
jgi:hypothetical protein